jgi:hypothetical protein
VTCTGIILYSLFFAFLTALIANRKGYNIRDWFWLGLFLGIIATGIIFFQPKKTKNS